VKEGWVSYTVPSTPPSIAASPSKYSAGYAEPPRPKSGFSVRPAPLPSQPSNIVTVTRRAKRTDIRTSRWSSSRADSSKRDRPGPIPWTRRPVDRANLDALHHLHAAGSRPPRSQTRKHHG